MVDENKNWTLTDVVFNVHRGRTYGNLNKEERVKDLYGGMVFYLKVVKKKKKSAKYTYYKTQSNHQKNSWDSQTLSRYTEKENQICVQLRVSK